MDRIFNPEGPLFSSLGRLADLFWLNILFIVCCLPVFTIGAATTAMYYVTLKMAKNEEGYITKSFFRAFKQNFKQATVIWLIALVVGAILVGDWMIVNGTLVSPDAIPDMPRKVLVVMILVVLLVYVFILRYVFPLLSKFDNTVRNTVKNALLISIRHLPYTVVLLAIPVAVVAAGYFVNAIGVLTIIIGFASIAYVSSKIFVKIFENYIPDEEAESVVTAEESVSEEAQTPTIASSEVSSEEN